MATGFSFANRVPTVMANLSRRYHMVGKMLGYGIYPSSEWAQYAWSLLSHGHTIIEVVDAIHSIYIDDRMGDSDAETAYRERNSNGLIDEDEDGEFYTYNGFVWSRITGEIVGLAS